MTLINCWNMMISEGYEVDIYISDYTNYTSKYDVQPIPNTGVVVDCVDRGIIPSFAVVDENHVPFRVINNEHNPAVFKRQDGTRVSQCECIVYADRNDNRKGWLFFLELKYCDPKNRYSNILEGIGQLKATCKYILDEKKEVDGPQFKKYLVISTPGTEPLDPFDAHYFNQDDILSIKEETGAMLRASNMARIKTPAVVDFK